MSCSCLARGDSCLIGHVGRTFFYGLLSLALGGCFGQYKLYQELTMTT
jgi:hypothetical protein